MKKRLIRAKNTVRLYVANRGSFSTTMCSICGQRPPDIGTMCNPCAGR